MKYLFAVLLCLLLSACTASLPSKEVRMYAIDFRPYTNNGFLFTTDDYNGEYESIGILSTVIFPEVKEVPTKKSFAGTELSYERISVKEVTDSVYTMAKEMGANAVIKFEAKSVQKTFDRLIVQGIEVNGFAIKRKITN